MKNTEIVNVEVSVVDDGFDIELVVDRTGVVLREWGVPFSVPSREIQTSESYEIWMLDGRLSAQVAAMVSRRIKGIRAMTVPPDASMFQVRLIDVPYEDNPNVTAQEMAFEVSKIVKKVCIEVNPCIVLGYD